MREIRQSGSEGGAAQSNALSLPLSQLGALTDSGFCPHEDGSLPKWFQLLHHVSGALFETHSMGELPVVRLPRAGKSRAESNQGVTEGPVALRTPPLDIL